MKGLHQGTVAAIALAATAVLGATGASAKERLTLYCSVDNPWCEAIVREFQADTGIDVAMTRKSSGETFAQIKAESNNPKGDVWFGGTGDSHLQAAEEGLTEAYQSPLLGELHDWAVAQAKDADYRTVGVYTGAVGFGYNTEQLAKRNLPEPTCWKDLAKPEYADEVQIANPNSSGTAYTTLATFVQMWGEDEAFDFLRAMHNSVNQYTKSGSAPIKAAANGETTIGITFLHDIATQISKGMPVVAVAPCEGTGYEIGSMSLIKGARNPESARKFYDWALTPKAQELAAEANQFQSPANRNAKTPQGAPDLSQVKLIDYDFRKYGSSAERTRLLAKWDKEIGSLPK